MVRAGTTFLDTGLDATAPDGNTPIHGSADVDPGVAESDSSQDGDYCGR